MTEEPNQQPEQSGDQSAPRLYDLGAALVESSRGSIYCLTIIGQVEGHSLAPNNTKTTKYEHVLPLLAHLEQSEEVDGVLLLLNTVGGDIEAGLAIAEMVAGMTKPTVTLVLGGGHSIGIPPGGVRTADLHRALGVHDGAPGAHERPDDRRTPVLSVF